MMFINSLNSVHIIKRVKPNGSDVESYFIQNLRNKTSNLEKLIEHILPLQYITRMQFEDGGNKYDITTE